MDSSWGPRDSGKSFELIYSFFFFYPKSPSVGPKMGKGKLFIIWPCSILGWPLPQVRLERRRKGQGEGNVFPGIWIYRVGKK